MENMKKGLLQSKRQINPRHDIGVGLFDLHSQYICYVKESKS